VLPITPDRTVAGPIFHGNASADKRRPYVNCKKPPELSAEAAGQSRWAQRLSLLPPLLETVPAWWPRTPASGIWTPHDRASPIFKYKTHPLAGGRTSGGQEGFWSSSVDLAVFLRRDLEPVAGVQVGEDVPLRVGRTMHGHLQPLTLVVVVFFRLEQVSACGTASPISPLWFSRISIFQCMGVLGFKQRCGLRRKTHYSCCERPAPGQVWRRFCTKFSQGIHRPARPSAFSPSRSSSVAFAFPQATVDRCGNQEGWRRCGSPQPALG